MRDLLYLVLALVSIALAAFFFYQYTSQGSADVGYFKFIVAVIFALLAIIFGGLFLSGRINKTDDIHITE